jgi:hypothetical protein
LYAEKTAGKLKLDTASVPHDKCRENYAATYVTRQKTVVPNCAEKVEKCYAAKPREITNCARQRPRGNKINRSINPARQNTKKECGKTNKPHKMTRQ